MSPRRREKWGHKKKTFEETKVKRYVTYKEPTICCFKYKDKNGLKVKGWEKIHHANTSQNYGGYINKVNFKANNIIREKRSFHNNKRVNLSEGCTCLYS